MRKAPRQERSRQMVERILGASLEVLRTDGYAAFTTNRVAAAAGISPGSLYQYFPNKQSILDEVIDRWTHEVSSRVTQSLANALSSDWSDPGHRVVDAVLAALEAEAPLLRIVQLELPGSRLRESVLVIERRIQELLAVFLAGFYGERVPAEQRPLKAWVITLTVEHLAVRWVLDETGTPREQIVNEIAALFEPYLAGGAPPRPTLEAWTPDP